jgi:hypothetical protein
MARERLNVDIDVLEAQLAHAKRGDVQKAYDRTTFDDQRREVMQQWADYLDERRTQVAPNTQNAAVGRGALSKRAGPKQRSVRKTRSPVSSRGRTPHLAAADVGATRNR